MIPQLDTLLQDVFVGGIARIASPAQVRFQPPDQQLRADVAGLNAITIDAYLAEVRENRTLRSNARARVVEQGVEFVTPAPGRFDCHYLITVWSPAQAAGPVDPTVDEHEVLYEALRVLWHAAPLNPSRVYPAGGAAYNAWHVDVRDADLPTAVLTVEGYASLGDFWQGMDQNARWKPGIHLVVTLPVLQPRMEEGPIVTTLIDDLGIRDDGFLRTVDHETRISIGGQVRRAGAPVEGAWVRVETPAGVPTGLPQRTGGDGRFVFDRLAPTSYRLRSVVEGVGERTRVIDVPSASGEYDLEFP